MEAVEVKVQYEKYPAYKDSGVEWLGEIPEGWEVVKLGKLLKTVSEKNYPDLPLLSITREKGVIERNIEDETENHNYIPDDLSGYKLLVKGQFGMNKMKAWQGSYGVSSYNGIVSPAYYVFDFERYVDLIYFNYAIRSKVYIAYFAQASDGIRIGQWDLSKSRMKEIPFYLPPLKEQTAIANFLDDKTSKIDHLISQKEKMILLLEERKQIVIQELVAGKKVWDEEKNEWLEPTNVKDSGVEWIGNIPENYILTKLSNFLMPVSEKNRPDLPLLSITREQGVIVRDQEDQESNHNFIPEDLSNYKLIKKGQFGMNKMKAWQGSYGVSKYDGIVSPAYYVFYLKADINCDFFHNAIRSKNYIPFFASASDGVRIGQWDLNKARMKEIPFVIPPNKDQVLIIEYIEKESTKINNAIFLNRKQIERLKEYKSILIDNAVTGKIKVI